MLNVLLHNHRKILVFQLRINERTGSHSSFIIEEKNMAESFPPPPSYENVMLEDVQKWNLPEEFHQAIQSFIQWPLDPPKNPYRYVNYDMYTYTHSVL